LSRVLATLVLGLLLLVAGCGGDDDENGGDEDRAETTTQTQEPIYPTVSPDGPIADVTEVPPPRSRPLAAAADAAGCELKHPRKTGGHVEPPQRVEYRSRPPTSGLHWPIPAEDGTYPRESPRPEELVHSLEHGRIVIHVDPGLEQSDKGGVQAVFEESPTHMLAVITPDLPYDVAAAAWGHLLGCRKVNDRVYDAIRAFRDRYRDQGPEDVP
jgi:uncharacterized protein DUF3105